MTGGRSERFGQGVEDAVNDEPSARDASGREAKREPTVNRRNVLKGAAALPLGSAVGEAVQGVDARIVAVNPLRSWHVQTGDVVQVEVTVENTGSRTHEFFVGFSAVAPDGTEFTNDRSTGRPVTISAGSTETVLVYWLVERSAPTGAYGIRVAVWAESDRNALRTLLDERLLERQFEVGQGTTGATARIHDWHVTEGAFGTGQIVTAALGVENTSGQAHTFFVGFSAVGPDGTAYNNERSTGQRVTLAGGALTTVRVDWLVERDAPEGRYTAHLAVWAEDDRDALRTLLDEVRAPGAFTVAR
jgi:hypothetical protein